MAKYTYAISTGTPNGAVAEDSLKKEIQDSTISVAIDFINTSGDVLDVHFKAALSANDQITLTLIVNNHDGEPLEDPIQTVIVREETAGVTQGEYQARSFEMQIDNAQGTTKEYDIVFPYAVSVFSAYFVCKSHHSRDIVEAIIAPDTIIGAITSDVSIGDTEINVQQSVIDNLKLGYHVKLFNGVDADDLGQVIAINKLENKITLENATTFSFSASSPTYVMMNIYFVKNFVLADAYRLDLGKDIIGGSALPANVPLRLKYTNREGTTTDKYFNIVLEYKY
jgi:hypothetical protein